MSVTGYKVGSNVQSVDSAHPLPVTGTVAVSGGGGTSAAPSVEVEQGLGTLATGQVTVAATVTAIAAARSTRNSITIVNHSAIDIYVGITGVTTSTGVLLAAGKGNSITLQTTAAVYGISASGSNVVSFAETY